MDKEINILVEVRENNFAIVLLEKHGFKPLEKPIQCEDKILTRTKRRQCESNYILDYTPKLAQLSCLISPVEYFLNKISNRAKRTCKKT